MVNSKNSIQNQKDLGLYIHIPFCVKKCDYCDFLSAPADEETKQRYFEALYAEINSFKGRSSNYIVPTIFFGGGTPSCVDAHYIRDIMNVIGEVFQLDQDRMEATIEVNPGTLSKEKLGMYKKAGINRLSFGLQSANDDELKLLGRIHTYKQFEDNYLLAREIGFTNINIDLMSALPGQTINSWEETLNKVLSLNPEHISAYSLIIEEGTPFYERYGANEIEEIRKPNSNHNNLEEDLLLSEKKLPDEDTDRIIYHNTKNILVEHGFHRYEISNYAKLGYECKHNSSYWIGTDYLGLGIGASSLLNGARYKNVHDIKQYIKKCNAKNHNTNLMSDQISDQMSSLPTDQNQINNQVSNQVSNQMQDILGNQANNQINNQIIGQINDEIRNHDFLNLEMNNLYIDQDYYGIHEEYIKLTKQDQMEEFMFLGLRMCHGVSMDMFYKRFGVRMDVVYQDVLQKLMKLNLLEEKEDNIRLTEYGIDVSNMVLSEFLLK